MGVENAKYDFALNSYLKTLLKYKLLLAHVSYLYYSIAYEFYALHTMKGFCITFVITTLALAASYFPEHAPALIEWINHWGYIAPIFFLLIYCFSTLFFLPTMVMTLVGGALFGPFLGTIFNVFSATTGATLAFAISRYWIRDWLHLRSNQTIDQLIHGVDKRGWQFVALMRLLPIIPFNLVNYGLGLTQIKFNHYLLTTFIFLIPLEIISTYCGHAGMDFLIHSSLFYKRILLAGVLLSGAIYLIVLAYKKRAKV